MGTATHVKELNGGNGSGAVYRFDPPVQLGDHSWDLGWVSSKGDHLFMGFLPIPARTDFFPATAAILDLPEGDIVLDENAGDEDVEDWADTYLDIPAGTNPPDHFSYEGEDHEGLLNQMGYDAVQYPVVAN